MQEGDVVLTPVPQADGTVKNRPAIVLREMPVYRDVLVCGAAPSFISICQGLTTSSRLRMPILLRVDSSRRRSSGWAFLPLSLVETSLGRSGRLRQTVTGAYYRP